MASYQKRTNGDGTKAVLAWVRIKPFKPASKSFAAMPQAREWAEALEAELKKQRKVGQARTDLTSLTIKGLVDDYLKDAETRSLRYFDDLSKLLAWWVNRYGADKVLGFGTLKLREAREALHSGRGPATVNRYLSALRSAWNWGRAAGLVPQEKVWPTRLMLTEPRERVRFLTDAELAKVLEEAAKVSTFVHAAIITSLGTGVRQGELLRLTWADLDFERKTLTVHVSKSGRRRAIHLPDPAIAALKLLKPENVDAEARIFLADDGAPAEKDYLNYRWTAVRAAAGVKDVRWHDLRHSCASYLAQNGATLLEIGTVLGHSSPSITSKYAHLVTGAAVTGSAALADKLRGNS